MTYDNWGWDGLVDWPDEFHDEVDKMVEDGWSRGAAEAKTTATLSGSDTQPVIRIRR